MLNIAKITATICIFFNKQFAIFLETNREVMLFNVNGEYMKRRVDTEEEKKMTEKE